MGRRKVAPDRPTAATFFCGVGGACAGLKESGFEVVWGNQYQPTEMERLIGSIWQLNHPRATLDRRSLLEIPIDELPVADLFWCSPPCPEFSVAKANRTGGTKDEDTSLAQAIVNAITHRLPRWVALENVEGYLRSASWRLIAASLAALGYRGEARVLNAADYGAATSRDRLIGVWGRDAIASLPNPTHTKERGEVGQCSLFGPPLRPWVGWEAAIAHLIPSMPATTLAMGQVQPVAIALAQGKGPLLVQRNGYGVAGPQIKEATEPCWTLTASQPCDGKPAPATGLPSFRSPLTAVYDGQPLHCDHLVMAAIMGFPPDYQWGDDGLVPRSARSRGNVVAARGCGNAVAVELAKAIGLSFAKECAMDNLPESS